MTQNYTVGQTVCDLPHRPFSNEKSLLCCLFLKPVSHESVLYQNSYLEVNYTFVHGLPPVVAEIKE
jgi:hypothetical protein